MALPRRLPLASSAEAERSRGRGDPDAEAVHIRWESISLSRGAHATEHIQAPRIGAFRRRSSEASTCYVPEPFLPFITPAADHGANPRGSQIASVSSTRCARERFHIKRATSAPYGYLLPNVRHHILCPKPAGRSSGLRSV